MPQCKTPFHSNSHDVPMYFLRVLRRSRSLFEHLPIPDSAFACIARQLEVLRQFKCIHRTGILTEPTEHAAREVVGKSREVLAAGVLCPHAVYPDHALPPRLRAKGFRE